MADVDTMVRLVGGIPAIMFLVFTLLMTFGYRLSEEKVKIACEANVKTMSERSQAAQQKAGN